MGKGAFEVWVSTAEGLQCGPSFPKLSTALRYVGAHLNEASFAIKLPNNLWFENGEGGILFSRTGEPEPLRIRRPVRITPSHLESFGVTKGGYWLAATTRR